jgi:hypothetical protein
MSKSCFFSQPYPGKKLCTWVWSNLLCLHCLCELGRKFHI